MRIYPVRSTLTLLLLFILVAHVPAHSPSDLQITDDPDSGNILVTLTHQVRDMSTHYVQEIVLRKNGEVVDTFTYTSQPSAGTFTYRYHLPLERGDTVSVAAHCNLGGSITGEYTRPGGDVADSAGSPSPAFPAPPVWAVHALLVGAGFLCILGLSLLPVYGTGIREWYRYHIILALAGGVLLFSAIAIVFRPAQPAGASLPWQAHIVLGLLLVLLFLFILVLGIYRKRAGEKRALIRTVHLWLGRIMIVLVVINIFLGLFAVCMQ